MVIDFRCATRSTHGGRCQLLAGHEAAHALVHDDPQQAGVRILSRWKPGELARSIPVGPDPSALCLPWAPGMPVTVHAEPAAPADPADAAPAPAAVVRMTPRPAESRRALRPVTFIGREPAHRSVRAG